ncbi:MAG: polysaccharide biosynthesis protein [Acutalibacteraceae bacterium]
MKKLFKINERKFILVCADLFIVGFGTVMAGFILDVLSVKSLSDRRIALITLSNMVVCFLTMYISGAYSKIWRYFKIKDYISASIGMASGLILSSTFLYWTTDVMKLNFFLISLVICTTGVLVFRLLFRKTFLVLTDEGVKSLRKRTMIIGAGEACKIILKDIKNAKHDPRNPSAAYNPICLVDDDASKQRQIINGVEVMGTTNDIPSLCKTENIEVIMFAIPSCSEANRKRILDICSETQCIIKVIPYLGDMLFDDKTKLLGKVTDIRVEDLLGRDPVSFDNQEVQGFIKGKVCMITGGGGSIGSELTRQIAKYDPKQVIIVDIYENNAYDIEQELKMDYGNKLNLVTLISSVRDYDKMKLIFEKYRPDIVFHAAAHKHVPLMETVPEEAVKNNVLGTFNVANLSQFYKVKKFVMISTDKAVNPTNVMGATKRCCEMIVQYMAQYESETAFITTRFGNVLGSNGSVIPLFKRQIESGKPVTVTSPDIIRYFMTIPEAVSLVLQASAMAAGGEIFVLDMGAPVKILTLAENLIRMYGKVPYKDVPIIFTGLRPGEKMKEELLMDEEGLKTTPNKKIYIGHQIEIEPDVFIQKIEKLKEYAKNNDSEKTLAVLKEIVPTFNHNS